MCRPITTPEQGQQPHIRLRPRQRLIAGQPGVDRPGEDERHQAQVDEVERHVGERQGQRDPAVARASACSFGR